MAPKAKGSGEAEAYWEEFRSHLVPNEILYGLVRIVMGDAESRRPKFVFVIWLGRQCSVMQKAPVGMQKGDVKRVIGAIHLEIETDAVDELELASVKKQLKKSMGADYDMGSNSRSASGKEGNADKASGAEVRYETQQSAIKAKAAAAYEGGHTVKVSGGIGSLSPKPASSSAAVGQYRCVKKSQIRSGFEMDSAKAGVMAVGTELEALELRVNDKGVTRVRFSGGWLSEKTGAGALCLQAQAPPA